MERLCCEESLLKIEMLREKMVSTALLYGFNHPLVLEYSQKIDEKHNEFLTKQKKRIVFQTKIKENVLP
ncbi:aspartyl-phosphate phosphatase Spo0E family protein [Alkalihalobacillus sp. BA299]|uniref:aspartyl-phosphate phosphatase Spo0E family protein n=1 Tax=Alkalihalobacillus sp. BA299 TaxID=2815938 RepID=UPI001FFDF1BE|nr:aspartyl-phosphate phosphatase Spo0E family protein [Alkalihalobacillus sp. BA299]